MCAQIAHCCCRRIELSSTVALISHWYCLAMAKAICWLFSLLLYFLSVCKLFFIHWVLSVFSQLLNRKSFFLSTKFIKIMIKANTMWKERVVYLPSRNDRLAAFSYLFKKNGCTWLLCFHQLCSMWTVDCTQSIEFKWNESSYTCLYLKAIFFNDLCRLFVL